MEFKIQFLRSIKFRLYLIFLLGQFCISTQMNAQEDKDLGSLGKEFLFHIESANSNPEGIIEFIEDNKKDIPKLITHLANTLTEKDSLNYKLSQASSFIYLTSTQEGKYLALKSHEMALENKDTANVIFASSALGTVTGEMGEFQEALGYFFGILELTDPVDHFYDYTSALNEIGRLYIYLNDFENAEKYLEQQIALGNEHGDYSLVNVGYLNLGALYTEWGKSDLGLKYMEKSYQYGIEVQDTAILYNSLGNLASLYFEKNEIQKAIDLQQKGLAFEVMFNNKVAMIDSYGNLALFHSTLNNKKESLEYYEKALSLALALNVVDKTISVYGTGVEIHTSWGGYEKALEASKLQFALYDSALSLERNNQVAEMREKYETEKKETDILNLEKDKQLTALELSEEKGQNTILIILTTLFLVIALSGFLIFFYTRKRKREIEARNELITGINKKLNQSQDALLEANKTRDKFFALIAHDLRGPIASFQGIGRVINYMLKKGKTENTQELIKSVDESANRINSLLDNLLKWALSQTGALPFNPAPLHLNVALEDTLQIYEQSYQAKNIRLTNTVSEDLWVHADHNSISTVLRNLLGNALKFTPEGGEVALKSEVVGQQVSITVSDNGVGIAPEKLDSLFKIDHNKSTQGTSGEKGTGLGLMLCKEFIIKHGGEINIESQPGKGTSISFSLSVWEHQKNEHLTPVSASH